MVKIISTVSLKPGYDPDETYQIWLNEHVPYVKSVYSGLQGYVIGRVLHSLAGGEFFGAVQLSIDTLENAIRGGNQMFINPPDEFMNRTTNVRRVIIREEEVMGDLKLKMVKFIGTFGLKPGYDPDETYRIWVNEHVPYVKKAMVQELKGYIIGRVIHNLTGGEFFGAAQLSYETLDDAIRAQNRTLVINPPDEFLRRTTNVRRVIIQEVDVMGDLKLK